MRHYLGQVDDLDIKAATSIAEITSLAERADGSIVVAMPMVVVAKEFGARRVLTYTGQGADRYAVVTREDAQRVGAPILADPWAAYQAGQALPGPQAAQVKGRRIPIPQEGRRWVPWAIVGGGMAVALGAMLMLSSKKSVKPNRRRSSRRLRRNVSKRSITRNGTAAQHAAMSNKHLEAAREELEWLRHGPAHNAATKKKLVAKIRRHLDQAAAECWWTRGKAKARCEDDIRRLDAELAAVTRKKRTSKRLSQNPKRRSSGGKEPVTKKGKYGTMYLYEIHFEDDYDPAQPEWMRRTMKYGYDREHAIQRFYDSYFGDPGDVQVKSAKRVLR